MRIAFDARPLFDLTNTPQSVHLRRLYQSLRASKPDWKLIGYHHSSANLSSDNINGIHFKHVEARSPQAWHKRAYAAAKADDVDVIHTNSWNAPARSSVDTVVSIDHLLPWDMPQGHALTELSNFQTQIKKTCKRASRIICPTSSIANTLINDFGAYPNRVSVVAPAFDEFTDQVPPNKWKPVLDRYGVNRPFVLHYGPDETRRNTRKLIEAWAMSDAVVRNALQLVIVGVSEESGKDLATVSKRLGLGKSVRLLRWFNEPGDQQTLMSAADIVAQPYLAEGFPEFALQSWAARAAVLTSPVSGIDRIVGEAGLMIDPNDACAIARGVKRLVVDGRFRRQLIVKGEQRIKDFTWQQTAENFAREIERTKGILVSLQPARDKTPLRRAA